MPNDTALETAAAVAQKEREEQELKLLEEVVRQAEVRLTALAQVRQGTVAKTVTIMSWMLTLVLALAGALSAIFSDPDSGLAWTKPALIYLLMCTMLGTALNMWTAAGNAFPKFGSGPWYHAGSNPRDFVPGIPVTEKSTLTRRIATYLQRQRRAGKPSQAQTPDLPRTKKEALLDTAKRYAQAIDENEWNLARANAKVAYSLVPVVTGTLIGVLFLKDLSKVQRSPAQPPTATVPTTPSRPPPAATPAAPGTLPPNPATPNTPEPRTPS